MTIDMRPGDPLPFHTMRQDVYREELETAWLRGYVTGSRDTDPEDAPFKTWVRDSAKQGAADYAERVVGGSTRPEVER